MSVFIEKLQDIVTNLTNLTTVTAVGNVTVSGDIKKPTITIPAQEQQKAIVTNVNLIDGDISTVMHPAFAEGSMPAISELHKEMQLRGSEIVERNVKLLKELINSGLVAIKESSD